MRLYLSGQWSRRDEIAGYAELLRGDGHEVASEWHESAGIAQDDDEASWEQYARADLQEIADMGVGIVVAFTEPGGDYRHQHYAKGCKICGRAPWERGVWACVGFVEKGDTPHQIRAIEATMRADRKRYDDADPTK